MYVRALAGARREVARVNRDCELTSKHQKLVNRFINKSHQRKIFLRACCVPAKSPAGVSNRESYAEIEH
jgi:hypothetical protein